MRKYKVDCYVHTTYFWLSFSHVLKCNSVEYGYTHTYVCVCVNTHLHTSNHKKGYKQLLANECFWYDSDKNCKNEIRTVTVVVAVLVVGLVVVAWYFDVVLL